VVFFEKKAPCATAKEKGHAPFPSFGLFKVHFSASEQHRREVYLLIFIDILIGLHQCLNASQSLCIGVLMQTFMYPISASPR